MTDLEVRNALTLAAHKEATRQLRSGPSYANAAPNSYDVRDQLKELGIVIDRETVFVWCKGARLPLIDQEIGDPDDITKKLPTVGR